MAALGIVSPALLAAPITLPPFARRVESQIPPARLPRPNAFDRFAAAGRRARALPWDLNLMLQDAWGQRRSTYSPAFTPEQRQRAVTAAQPLLREVRAAFATPCQLPDSQTAAEDLRSLSRLFALESTVRAEKGEMAGAVQSALDGIRFGCEITRGTTLQSRRGALAAQANGRRSLWRILDQINGATAKQAALRLESATARQESFAATMTAEKWRRLASMLREYRGDPQTRALWGQDTDTAFRDMVAVFDARIALARLSYNREWPEPRLKPTSPARRRVSVNTGRVTGGYGQFGQMWFENTANDTENALLCVTLALRAFRAERGAYPSSLDELVKKGYLRRAPIDPFSPEGNALRYRRDVPDRYLLYSVGPDAENNDGAPARSPRAPLERQQHIVRRDSTGDIVAGVNTGRG